MIRTNFTKDWSKSLVSYNAMWKTRKYESAVLGHTGKISFWH